MDLKPGEQLIRRARHHRGRSLGQLATAARVHPSTLAKAEVTAYPSMRQLTRYAELLGFEVHVCFREPGDDKCVIE